MKGSVHSRVPLWLFDRYLVPMFFGPYAEVLAGPGESAWSTRDLPTWSVFGRCLCLSTSRGPASAFAPVTATSGGQRGAKGRGAFHIQWELRHTYRDCSLLCTSYRPNFGTTQAAFRRDKDVCDASTHRTATPASRRRPAISLGRWRPCQRPKAALLMSTARDRHHANTVGGRMPTLCRHPDRRTSVVFVKTILYRSISTAERADRDGCVLPAARGGRDRGYVFRPDFLMFGF